MGLLGFLFKPPNVEKMQEKGDIKGLIKAMGHKDWQVRQKAEFALEDAGDKAVDRLISAAKKGKAPVRQRAVEALGEIGSSKGTMALVHAVGDSDEEVRWRAASALIKTGEPAVGPVAKLLEHRDPDFHWRAMFILARIGHPALSTLEDCLNKKDKALRARAEETIEKIYRVPVAITPASPGAAPAGRPLAGPVVEEPSLPVETAAETGKVDAAEPAPRRSRVWRRKSKVKELEAVGEAEAVAAEAGSEPATWTEAGSAVEATEELAPVAAHDGGERQPEIEERQGDAGESPEEIEEPPAREVSQDEEAQPEEDAREEISFVEAAEPVLMQEESEAAPESEPAEETEEPERENNEEEEKSGS